MSELKWEKVTEVMGQLEGDVIKSYLEANDISVQLFQEAVGKLIGSSLDSFGRVEIFVPLEQSEAAKQLLEKYREDEKDTGIET